MGLIPTYCRKLIWLHKKVGLEGPLITLGNQDVWADYEQLKSFFREMECPYSEAAPVPHSSRLFSQRPEAKDFVQARTFFEMLGIKEYYDIDKFDIDSPQILHDLNVPVPPELESRFNLIIDGGTIEHIFDVRQVMGNIVRMCRPSGWVVHITPSSNYIDHGFYCFSPCFFYDFYQANGFGEFICYVIQLNGQNMYEPCPYFEYTYGMDLSELIDPRRVSVVFFAARKVGSPESVVVPTQGDYTSRPQAVQQGGPAASASAGQPATVSLTERLVPAALTPYLKPIRPLLGAVRRKITPPYRQLRRI